MRAGRRRRTSAGAARPRRALRTSTALLLVVLIPFAASVTGIVRQLQTLSGAASAAARVERSAQRAVDLSALQAGVLNEMNARSAVVSAQALGMGPELVQQLMGADLTAELDAAQRRVDAALDRLALADPDALAGIGVQLAALREQPPPTMADCLTRYDDVAQQINALQQATFQSLAGATAGAQRGIPALVASIERLQAAESARRAIALQQAAYFSTTFAVRSSPQEELTNLILIRADYLSALEQLRRATDNEHLQAALQAIDASPALNDLGALVQERIDQSVQQGLPATLPALSLTSVMADLDGLQVIYGASKISTDTHLALVDATTTEVLERAAELRRAATTEARAWYVFAALLVVVTLGAAAVATRFIVRPLGALREAANRLRAGTVMPAGAPTGPLEVRAAAAAIGDAAAHLDLATRQAQALAGGDLDDAVFDEREQGGLGRALQDAVHTLRTALAQQDEFRRRLAHEAAHDGLTHLPNRSASMVQLTRSIARTARADTQLAVLFIDLDHFKEVNDHHGHQAGDIVLTTVAERLARNVREGDHVGRLGGDEFVVIAEPVSGHEEAVELAERLRRAVELPIDIRTAQVHVGASIGIAFATEDLTADELLRDADLAVYRVKELGRGGVEICDEDLRAKMVGDADLSNALRHAIATDELLLHYQPIVEAGTGVVRGFEALVRWRRPGEERLVPPDQFIPLAERSALIIDLDRWVLRSAAAQIARWDRAGEHGVLPVSINVSSRHLGHEHFVRHVLEPLREAGVPPERIIIEVTETALLNDLADAADKLQTLRRNGVRVAIDDFGTGYTSLAHLRSLPVDILKIDRSFTAQILSSDHDASIVQLIIDTGHLLGAAVTVEGVETGDEAAKLVELGSDSLQGYYFARPQPPELLTRDERLEGQPTAGGAPR